MIKMEKLYREREKRIDDAVKLKKPDRVPVMVEFSYFRLHITTSLLPPPGTIIPPGCAPRRDRSGTMPRT
jgi:hypothetical protein